MECWGKDNTFTNRLWWWPPFFWLHHRWKPWKFSYKLSKNEGNEISLLSFRNGLSSNISRQYIIFFLSISVFFFFLSFFLIFLKAGYHKKAINCSCLLSTKTEGTATILTGSEDNSIRLCSIDQLDWKSSSSYLRHISSVRAVALVDDVLVTAGGRAQMILWHIQNYSGK